MCPEGGVDSLCIMHYDMIYDMIYAKLGFQIFHSIYNKHHEYNSNHRNT